MEAHSGTSSPSSYKRMLTEAWRLFGTAKENGAITAETHFFCVFLRRSENNE